MLLMMKKMNKMITANNLIKKERLKMTIKVKMMQILKQQFSWEEDAAVKII